VRTWMEWLPSSKTGRHPGFVRSLLLHWGAYGLFGLAILDSTPLPTFGGPDILTAILSARHHDPWYAYAAAATAGSLIGAFLTFRLARRAGLAYLHKHFHGGRIASVSRLLDRWGTVALAITAGVPFPLPTTIFFAVAGASNYDLRKYLLVVGVCRALRYSLEAVLAEHYGRHFIHIVRHPAESWGWLLLLAALIAAGIAGAAAISRHVESASAPRQP
jgi:membrane protein YqaA with SNARE-associated domain